MTTPSDHRWILDDGLTIITGFMLLFVILLISNCSSNPRDDPNIYYCGDGYYARTKAECP